MAVNKLKQMKHRAFQSRSGLSKAPVKGSGFFELVMEAHDAMAPAQQPAEAPSPSKWPPD